MSSTSKVKSLSGISETAKSQTPLIPRRKRNSQVQRMSLRRNDTSIRANDSADVAFSHVVDLGNLDTNGKSNTAQYLHPMLFTQSPVSRIALAYGNFSIRELHISWAGTAGTTYSGAIRLAVVTGQGNINFDIGSMSSGRAFKSIRVSEALEWGVDLRDVFVQPRFSMSDPTSLAQVPILIISLEVAGASGAASAFGLLQVRGTIRFSMLGIQKTQVTQDKLTLRQVVNLAGTNTIVPNTGYVVQTSEEAQARYASALRATPNGGFFSRLLDLGKKVLFSLDSTGFIKGVVDGVSYLFNQASMAAITGVFNSVNDDEDVVLDVVMTQPHDEEKPIATQPVLTLSSPRVEPASTQWASNMCAIVGLDQFGSLVIMADYTYYPKEGWLRLSFVDDFFFSAPAQVEIYNFKEDAMTFMRIQDAEAYKPVLLQYASTQQIAQIYSQEIQFTNAGQGGVPVDIPDVHRLPLYPIVRTVLSFESPTTTEITSTDWISVSTLPTSGGKPYITVNDTDFYLFYDAASHTFFPTRWYADGSQVFITDIGDVTHLFHITVSPQTRLADITFYNQYDQELCHLYELLTPMQSTTTSFNYRIRGCFYIAELA